MLSRRSTLGVASTALALPFLARAQTVPGAVTGDLAQTLASRPGFGKFLGLCQRAGLRDRLMGTAQLTVFAPTDAAFDRMPVSLLNDLVGDGQNAPDPVRLPALVSHHMISGMFLAGSLKDRVADMPSVNGGLLRVDGRSGGLTVAITQPAGGAGSNFGTGAGGLHIQGPARIVQTDIIASNGVVHAIDKVLLP